MNKIAALYSRVSTEQQVKRGESIPFQKQCLEKKALELGYSYAHYSDEALSGGSTKRAEFLRMLSDVEAGKISAAIFYDLSRVSRDMLDSLLLRKTLDEHKVEILSVSEDIDFKTDEGDFMYKIKGLVNERYRKDLIKRVRAKMLDMANKGRFTGGQPSFGYKVKEKKLIINEDEATVLRQMFDRFEQNPSYRGITTWLNKAGRNTKRGTTFAQSTVRRLLTNTAYKGYPTWGKRPGGKKFVSKDKWITVKGDYEPIITEVQFDRVQDLIKSRKREYPQRKYGVTYLLSSLIRCECGGTLNGYTQIKRSSGKLYHYYKCHNWASKGTCAGNTWPKDVIENRVIEEVKKQVNLYFSQEEVSTLAPMQESAKEAIANARQKLKNLQSKQGKLIELYADGNIPRAELDKKMLALKTQIEEQASEIGKLDDDLNPKKKKVRLTVWERIQRLNGNFEKLSETTKKEILRQVIKGIVAYQNKELEIELYEV